MYTNLIVVDLDKTIIKLDSFRLLVLKNLYNRKILATLIARKLRIISSLRFKQNIIHVLTANNWFEINIDKFVLELKTKINKDVYDKILNESSPEDLIIVCSASPDFYVKKIAKELGWLGFGSFMVNNTLFNMHGVNKLKFLYDNFPKEKYKYKYSISDSHSDMELLKQFEKWEFYKC